MSLPTGKVLDLKDLNGFAQNAGMGGKTRVFWPMRGSSGRFARAAMHAPGRPQHFAHIMWIRMFTTLVGTLQAVENNQEKGRAH